MKPPPVEKLNLPEPVKYTPKISVQSSPPDLTPAEEWAILGGCIFLGVTVLTVILLCKFP